MPTHAATLPSFAGVCDASAAARTGFSVAEAAQRLRRIAFVKQRLAWIATAHLSAAPEWELKSALALHAWYDAQHVNWLRERLLELREPPGSLDDVPDPALEALLLEALHSRGSAELVTAIYGVLRPALLEAMQRYMAQTNPLADQPSCRLLKLASFEESEAIAWGRSAMEALPSDPGSAWRQHLLAYLEAANGIDGKETPRDHTKPSTHLPAPRATKPFAFDVMPKRDARFTGLFDTSIPADTIYADESRPLEERNLALLFKRLREMDVPEAIAGILAQTPGKPWDFYADMLRQMWDEARHALLGQAALEARGVDWTRLPVNLTFSYKLARFCNPQERHVLLFAIEQSLMPAQHGKRWEHQIAKQSGDALSTTFHDFDWADEVLHAAIGKKHLRTVFHGDYNAAFQQAEALAARIAQGLQREPMPPDAPPPDWWEHFAGRVLGHPVAPAPRTDLKEWNPTSSSSA